MKKNIFFSVILLILVTAFIVYRPVEIKPPVTAPPPLNNNITSQFIVGAIDEEYDYISNYWHTDQLGFNISHKYAGYVTDEQSGKHYPHGRTPNDGLTNSISEYQSEVTAILDNVYSHGQRRSIINRPKIEYLCYGKRSDYKCKPVPENDDLWFYAFNNHETGIPEPDNEHNGGETVMHCRTMPTSPDDPGFVVRRLKANTEQCHRDKDFDGWRGDSEHDWYIKPRIRVDKDFASNPLNEDVNICRIDIYNQDGYDPNNPSLHRIISKDIKAGYFQINYPSNYDGEYLEEFYFIQNQPPSAIIIPKQDWGDKWNYKARGTCEEYPEWLENKADIQVYWYGNCDMWIDYVRVDNDVADGLLGGKHSGQYDQWIREAANSAYVNIFVIDPRKYEFNNLPCIKYIERKMKEYSNGRFAFVYQK